MRARKSTYLMHRWLGLLVSLQLLAWSIGGFLFSVLPLDLVRGEQDVAAPMFEPMSPEAALALPEQISAALNALRTERADVATVAIVDRGVGPAWEVRCIAGDLVARLDPTTGARLERLTPDDAASIAKRDFAHAANIISIVLIESEPPIEYREGVLPAYVVTLDRPNQPHIYIDANSGQVTARRNTQWRIFDFFWMLHTMDYAGRDNFNHWLLTAFSVLAVLTSGSGLTLWIWRVLSRRKVMPT